MLRYMWFDYFLVCCAATFAMFLKFIVLEEIAKKKTKVDKAGPSRPLAKHVLRPRLMRGSGRWC